MYTCELHSIKFVTVPDDSFSSTQGDHVWLETHPNAEFNVPIGAVVKDSDSGRILLEDDEGKVGYVITFCKRGT